MYGRFPFLLCAEIIPMLRHFHPTLAGPILDLKRNPAEFCLIDPIVRQVWCDSPTSSRLAEGSAVKYKKQCDKWPQEEQRAVVSLWAERHELLVSKDVRKNVGRNCAWVKSQVGTRAQAIKVKRRWIISSNGTESPMNSITTIRLGEEWSTCNTNSA